MQDGWYRIDGVAGRFASISPRSGWMPLMDSLSNLGIYTLPDASDLPKYSVSTDSWGGRVEVAKPNYYKIYGYLEYEKNAATHVEAQKFVQILKLIEREFNINVIY